MAPQIGFVQATTERAKKGVSFFADVIICRAIFFGLVGRVRYLWRAILLDLAAFVVFLTQLYYLLVHAQSQSSNSSQPNKFINMARTKQTAHR